MSLRRVVYEHAEFQAYGVSLENVSTKGLKTPRYFLLVATRFMNVIHRVPRVKLFKGVARLLFT